METIEIIAQIISIAAMVVYFLSYQQKKQRTAIFFQLIATTLFSLSFFMLGAMMGFVLNVISAVRAVLFMYKKQLKTDNIFWFVGFMITYAACYVMSFTVFGTEFTLINALLELCPVIGMVATTFGFRAKSAKAVRISGLVNEPAWMVYNIAAFSIGAIASNVFSIASIVIGLIRLDKKGKSTDEQ